MLERQREQFFENPSHRVAFAALEEADYVSGRWESLVELYQQRLEAPDLEKDPTEKTRILLRLAQVLDERCGRKDEAFELYQKILQAAPKNRTALQRLRQIHAERGQWEMVLQIAELAEQADLTDAERSALQTEMGEVWLDKLHDAEQARALFERASQGVATSPRLLKGLAKSLQALHQNVECERVLQRLIEETGSGPACAEAFMLLAALYEEMPERASETPALYQRAHAEDPKNLDAIESLIILAMTQNQWDVLNDLQERHFQLATGARMRAAIALEAGLLQLERLGNTTLARHWLERARQLAPSDPEVHFAFATLERTDENLVGQKEALDQLVKIAGANAPTEIILEHASLCAAAGDDQGAICGLRTALQAWPESRAVLEMLSNLYRRNSMYTELLEVLEKRATVKSFSPTEHAAILAEIGMVHEELRGDFEQALDAYERAFLANPSILDVVPALERLYRRSGAWNDLRRFLESVIAQSEGTQRAELLCSFGELLHEKFQESERAKLAFEEALALQPASPRALSGLERLALGSGNSEELLASFLREANRCTDPARLEELIEQIVPRLEELDRHDEVLNWLERALELNPEHRQTLERVATLQEKFGRKHELCVTLAKLSDDLLDAELADNLRRRAKLHLDLNQPDIARELLKAALLAAPQHPDTLETLTLLESLLQRDEDVQALADVQEKLVALSTGEAKITKKRQLANLLAKRIGDTARALTLCRELRDAGDEECIALLEELLEHHHATDELVAHLAWRSARLEPNSSEALDLDSKRAELLLDPLERTDEAIALYRSIQARDANTTLRSETATLGIERAARLANDAHLLATTLGERAKNEDDPQQKAALEFERATLLEDALQEVEAARAIYTDLCQKQIDPLITLEAEERLGRILENANAWDELAALLQNKLGRGVANEDFAIRMRLHTLFKDRLHRTEAAADNLRQMLSLRPEKRELWQELAALFSPETQAAELLRTLEDELASDNSTASDTTRRITLHGQAAKLCTSLGNPERAEQHYQELLTLDPTHIDAVDFLAQRFEARSDWRALANVLENKISALRIDPTPESVDRRMTLQLRVAALLAEKLDDVPAAIRLLEDSLDEASTILPPAEVIAKLYSQRDDELALLKLCNRVLHEHRLAGDLTEWYLRQAQIQAKRGEYREASIAFHHALAARPRDPTIEAPLREMYRKLGEAEPLARMLETQLAGLTEPQSSDAASIHLELANIYRDALARPQEALVHFQHLLKIDPLHQDALAGALAITEELGNRDALLDLLAIATKRAHDPHEKAALLARRAATLAHEAQHEDAALASYREALALNPKNREARAALRLIFERQQRWTDLLDLLFFDAQEAETATERSKIYETAANIAENHLTANAALPWLARLRAEQPRDIVLLQRIQDLHRREQHTNALLSALESELELANNAERSLDIQLERAQIFEKTLASPGRAIRALEEARKTAATNPILLRELERLYEVTRQPRARAQILEAKLANTNLEDARSLHLALANLYESTLQEPLLAGQHFFESLRDTSGIQRIELLQGLGRSLKHTAQFAAWAQVAETELEALDPNVPVFSERRRELHRELAQCYENRLSQPQKAIQHYAALIALLSVGEDISPHEYDAAETRLLELLRQEGSHAATVACLQKRVERSGGTLEEWLDLARLHHEKMLAPVRAMSAYQKALERNPESLDALRGYRSVAEQIGRWPELAQSLRREIELAQDLSAPDRAALWHRLGQVSWRHLGSTTAASQAFAAAIECHPHDLESIRALEALFESVGDWRSAHDLYQSELDVLGAQEDERRHAVWIRISELASAHLDDRERAIHALESAQHIKELPVPQRLRLAKFYEQRGDLAPFAAVFASWCDDPASDANCENHLQLARVLETLERSEEALARVERAIAIDPQNPAAWDAAALLQQERGDLDAAANAYEKAASLLSPDIAATHLVQAADLVLAQDAARAAALLKKATERDPANALAYAKLARVAMQLDRIEQAELCAGRALDLATAEFSMPKELRLATAFVGADCARQRKRLESAARFYAAALAIEPSHPDALAANAEVLIALGDDAAASHALEARLALADENPARARHLQLLGQTLEAQNQSQAALARYEESLTLDINLQESHAGIVRILKATDLTQKTIDALLSWSEHSASNAERAAHLVHAAEIEIAADFALEKAEQQLRLAHEADPQNTKAGAMLAELLLQTKQPALALEVAMQELEHANVDAPLRARLQLVCAKVFEIQGDRNAAAEAYRNAAQADCQCTLAALSGARLLRVMGEWRSAAALLETFALSYCGEDKLALAEIYHQLARLQAGPLENLEAAIASYRKALQNHPGLQAAQESLTELLSQRPSDWDEAIARHKTLIEQNPLRIASLRALVQIALGRRHFQAAENGQAILRALGALVADERDSAPTRLVLPLRDTLKMENELWENLRQVAIHTRSEIAQARGASATPNLPPLAENDSRARFRNELLVAEGELAAPALVPLSTEALANTLILVSQIAFQADQVSGDGNLVNSLAENLGILRRRKIRKLLGETAPTEIARVDFNAWRTELRRLAAVAALAETNGELYPALAALLQDATDAEADAIRPDADLTSIAATCPEALDLLRRIYAVWLQTI